MFLGNRNIGDTLAITVYTRNPTTGALANATGAVVYSIKDDATGAEVTFGFLSNVTTGKYAVTLPLLDATFDRNTTYRIEITGTVAGVTDTTMQFFQVAFSPLVEAGVDLVQLLRGLAAFMLGKNTREASAPGTLDLAFRDINDTTTRVSMNVDSYANRLTVTLNLDD